MEIYKCHLKLRISLKKKTLMLLQVLSLSQPQHSWYFGQNNSVVGGGGGGSVHCGLFSSSPGLSPLDARSIPYVVSITNTSLPRALGGHNCPLVENHRHYIWILMKENTKVWVITQKSRRVYLACKQPHSKRNIKGIQTWHKNRT